jgi:hypothetical protein
MKFISATNLNLTDLNKVHFKFPHSQVVIYKSRNLVVESDMTFSDPVNGDDDCGQSDEESDHAADDDDDEEGQADAEHGRVQRLLLVTFLNI